MSSNAGIQTIELSLAIVFWLPDQVGDDGGKSKQVVARLAAGSTADDALVVGTDHSWQAEDAE